MRTYTTVCTAVCYYRYIAMYRTLRALYEQSNNVRGFAQQNGTHPGMIQAKLGRMVDGLPEIITVVVFTVWKVLIFVLCNTFSTYSVE